MALRTVIDYTGTSNRHPTIIIFLTIWNILISSAMPNTQSASIINRTIEPSPSIFLTLPTTADKATQTTKRTLETEISTMTTSDPDGTAITKSESEKTPTTLRSSMIAPTQISSVKFFVNDEKTPSTNEKGASVLVSTAVSSSNQTMTTGQEMTELVAMEIRVPLDRDVWDSTFKVKLSRGLMTAYRKGHQAKARRQRRAMLGKVNTRKMRNRNKIELPKRLMQHHLNIKSGAMKRYFNNVKLRVRRGDQDITAKILVLQRRSKASEKVDLQFNIYVGNDVMPAVNVIKDMNKLTLVELNNTLGFVVLRGPSLPSQNKPTQSPHQENKISQRALLMAVMIPVVVLVVLLPCLLINTEGISWKCLKRSRRKQNKVEPSQNGCPEKKKSAAKNPLLQPKSKPKRTTSSTHLTASPPVPTASPISSIIAQSKLRQANEKSVTKPRLAQSILQYAREREEIEKEKEDKDEREKEGGTENDKESKDGDSNGERIKEGESKTNRGKEKKNEKEKKKDEDKDKLHRGSVQVDREKKIENRKENHTRADGKELDRRRIKSQISKSILRHAKETKDKEIKGRLNDKMDEESQDNQNKNDAKKKTDKKQHEQHQGAVVEMFSNFSEKQLASPRPPRPAITRAWTWDNVTRPNKETILLKSKEEETDENDKEADDLLSMVLAERNLNKQLQKSKSDLPLEEIKKANKRLKDETRNQKLKKKTSKETFQDNCTDMEDKQPSLDFLRKKNKRKSRWKTGKVAPIDDVTPSLHNSVTQDTVTQQDVTQRDVTQRDVTRRDVTQQTSLDTLHVTHKNLTKHDVTPSLYNSVTQDNVTAFDRKQIQQNLIEMDVTQQQVTMQNVTQNHVTQQNDTIQDCTDLNVAHFVLAVKPNNNALPFAEKSQETAENEQKYNNALKQETSRNHSTVTQQNVTQYNNTSFKEHLEKKTKHIQKNNNEVTQRALQPRASVTQHFDLSPTNIGDVMRETNETNQLRVDGHRQREGLGLEDEMEIERQAREIVIQALARVCLE